ncbi:hypothetical protein ACP70R_045374 [Stipagrostis hirtigluma subsp. patula]
MELDGISNVAVEPSSQDGAEGTASSSLPQPRRQTSDRRQCGGQRPATVRRPTDGGLLARAEG